MVQQIKSALAVKNSHPEREQVPDQYLTYLLGGEMFAMKIAGIREIIEFGEITAIPLMHGFISGVINLRGAVVPVIDLAVRFGRSASEIGRRTCIVIIETTFGELHQDIGVIVDAVSEVLEIPLSNIANTPSFGTQLRADFIQGMAKIAGRFVIILDIDQVLSIEEMSQLVQISMQDTANF